MWKVMVRKDLRLIRRWALLELVIVAFISLLLVLFSYCTQSGLILCLIVASFLLLGHILYFPILVWVSISREFENTSSLWLLSPQSGWFLISSKLVSSLIPMLFSVLLIIGTFYWMLGLSGVHGAALMNTLVETGFPSSVDTYRLILWIACSVIVLGVELGFRVLLIIFCLKSVKYKLRLVRWVLGLFILFVPTVLFFLVVQSGIYDVFFSWGEYHLQIGHSPFLNSVSFNIGDIVFSLLWMALAFYISSWLLDRRIEV